MATLVITNIDTELEQAIQRYSDRNPNSLQLHKTALESLPGGNTRTLLHAYPFPISIKRGVGHELFDEDGHKSVSARILPVLRTDMKQVLRLDR